MRQRATEVQLCPPSEIDWGGQGLSSAMSGSASDSEWVESDDGSPEEEDRTMAVIRGGVILWAGLVLVYFLESGIQTCTTMATKTRLRDYHEIQ